MKRFALQFDISACIHDEVEAIGSEVLARAIIAWAQSHEAVTQHSVGRCSSNTLP